MFEMNLGNDTVRGKIRQAIIEKASNDEITILPPKFFGEIWIIGTNHKVASEYYKSKIENVKSKGAEIILHSEVEEKFNVAVVNKQNS